MSENILVIENLTVDFTVRNAVLHVLRGISLKVIKGESLVIVGESGCGKSVLLKSILGLLEQNAKIVSGSILYRGTNLTTFQSEKEFQRIRGNEIAMILQDPMTSLNPLITIGDQIEEAISIHQPRSKRKRKEEVIRLLTEVGIHDPINTRHYYPHECSGGMRQRVVIAIALACKPKILLCDEPTTALDATIQEQVLNLLNDLQQKYQLTVVYITHDFGVVGKVANRVAVMYAGEIVEVGTSNDIFRNARHPYTWSLLASQPTLYQPGEEIIYLDGTLPNPQEIIQGDAFAPRNPWALVRDFTCSPPYYKVSDTHQVKSWLMDKRAPKVEPPRILKEYYQLGKTIGEQRVDPRSTTRDPRTTKECPR